MDAKKKYTLADQRRKKKLNAKRKFFMMKAGNISCLGLFHRKQREGVEINMKEVSFLRQEKAITQRGDY